MAKYKATYEIKPKPGDIQTGKITVPIRTNCVEGVWSSLASSGVPKENVLEIVKVLYER